MTTAPAVPGVHDDPDIPDGMRWTPPGACPHPYATIEDDSDFEQRHHILICPDCQHAETVEPEDNEPMKQIPREIAAVEGCNCGGSGQYHRLPDNRHPGCSIFQLPPETVERNERAAEARRAKYVEKLNAQLRGAS